MVFSCFVCPLIYSVESHVLAVSQYVKYLYITCVCRIVTGSSRPFRPSAQLSYTFRDLVGRELVVSVTARDVCVHNLVCYSCHRCALFCSNITTCCLAYYGPSILSITDIY